MSCSLRDRIGISSWPHNRMLHTSTYHLVLWYLDHTTSSLFSGCALHAQAASESLFYTPHFQVERLSRDGPGAGGSRCQPGSLTAVPGRVDGPVTRRLPSPTDSESAVPLGSESPCRMPAPRSPESTWSGRSSCAQVPSLLPIVGRAVSLRLLSESGRRPHATAGNTGGAHSRAG